jgi:acyl-CoA reductase-like NAD-dependent aldehyde dehydrogenase
MARSYQTGHTHFGELPLPNRMWKDPRRKPYATEEGDPLTMSEHVALMVPGAKPAAERVEVRAPYDGSLIATLDPGDASAVETALECAAALYRDRDGWLSPGRRVEILSRAAALMTERRDELALEAAREGGKPLVDSQVEADRAIDGVKLCVEALRTQSGTEIPMDLNAASAGRVAFTRHEPIGPVVAFSAFNHPLNLIVHQVGPAIAAGCPVIVKPAMATPLSCMRFVSILRQAGLPEEWCQALLTTGHEVSGRLVSDPRVGFFSFIGSASVGWTLRSQLAPGTRCALEHGGVAPVIVAADADLDLAVPLLAKGGFYHAGQVCVSVQRVFAEREVARDLASRLSEAATPLRVGDPRATPGSAGRRSSGPSSVSTRSTRSTRRSPERTRCPTRFRRPSLRGISTPLSARRGDSTHPRSWSTTTPRFASTGCPSRASSSPATGSAASPTRCATCRSRR